MHTNALLLSAGHPDPAQAQQATIDGAAEIVTQPTLQELAPLIREGLRVAWQQLVPVGAWLRQVRDLELWFPRYESFQACCRVEFGIGKSRAYQVIEAEEVMAELPEKSTNGGLNERQMRELAKVPSGKRLEVLEKARAAAEAARSRLTAKIIRETARIVCPELQRGIAKKEARGVKIGNAPVSLQDLWDVWVTAKPDVQAQFLYKMKDHWFLSQTFKGQQRKIALVEATKRGTPRKRLW